MKRRSVILGAGSVGLITIAGASDQAPLQADATPRLTLNVLDFGCVGDGLTDDSVALQDALNSADGAVLLFPSGRTFVVSDLSFAGLEDRTLSGFGATIRGPSDRRVTSYFNLEGSVGRVRFEGLIFDQLNDELPQFTARDYSGGVQNCPIYSNASGGSVEIFHCRFINLHTSAVFWRGSGDIDIDHCHFQSGVQAQDQWAQHIHLVSLSSRINVRKCVFNNAPITNSAVGVCSVMASGISGGILLEDLEMDYCGRDNVGSHRLGAIDFYADVKNVTVRNVKAYNCMAQFMRLSSCLGAMIENIDITVNRHAELDAATLSIEGIVTDRQSGCQNISLRNVSVIDPYSRAASSVLVAAYDWGRPSTDILIENLRTSGARTAIWVVGPYDGLTIDGVIASGSTSQIRVDSVPTNGMGSQLGEENGSTYRDLEVRNVSLRNELTDSASDGITICLNRKTTASIGSHLLENVQVQCSARSLGSGVGLQLNSFNPSGVEAVCRRVQVINFRTAFYPRDFGKLSLQACSGSGYDVFCVRDGSVQQIDVA
jgi:Pectate lyase superfamily protein